MLVPRKDWMNVGANLLSILGEVNLPLALSDPTELRFLTRWDDFHPVNYESALTGSVEFVEPDGGGVGNIEVPDRAARRKAHQKIAMRAGQPPQPGAFRAQT